jgi:hypothetical protein
MTSSKDILAKLLRKKKYPNYRIIAITAVLIDR